METTTTTKKVSFTTFVDDKLTNVKQTTSLSTVAEQLNVLAKQYNNNIHYTVSVLSAHIRYRLNKDNEYLSKNNVKLDKDNNLVLITPKVKKEKKVTE